MSIKMNVTANLTSTAINYQPLQEPSSRGYGSPRVLLPELFQPSERVSSRGRGSYNSSLTQEHALNRFDSSDSGSSFSVGRGRGRGLALAENKQFVCISRAPTVKSDDIGVALPTNNLFGDGRKSYGRGNGNNKVKGYSNGSKNSLPVNGKFSSDDDLLLGPVMITGVKKTCVPTGVSADTGEQVVEYNKPTSKASGFSHQHVDPNAQRRPTREDNLLHPVFVRNNLQDKSISQPEAEDGSSSGCSSAEPTKFDAGREVASFTGVACDLSGSTSRDACMKDQPVVDFRSQKLTIDLSRRMRRAVQSQYMIAIEHDVHALQAAIRQQQINWLVQQRRNNLDLTVAPPQTSELETALRATKNLLRQKDSNVSNSHMRSVDETLQFLQLADWQQNPCRISPSKKPANSDPSRQPTLMYDDLLIWGEQQHLMDADFAPVRYAAKSNDLISFNADEVITDADDNTTNSVAASSSTITRKTLPIPVLIPLAVKRNSTKILSPSKSNDTNLLITE